MTAIHSEEALEPLATPAGLAEAVRRNGRGLSEAFPVRQARRWGFDGLGDVALVVLITTLVATTLAASARNVLEVAALGLLWCVAAAVGAGRARRFVTLDSPWVVVRLVPLVALTAWAGTGLGLLTLAPQTQLALVLALVGAGLLVRCARLLGAAGPHHSPRRVVLVGSVRDLALAAESVTRTDRHGTRRCSWQVVAGVVRGAGAADLGAEVPVLAETGTDLADVVRQHRADTVLVVPDRISDGATERRLAWALEGLPCRLLVATPLVDVGSTRSRLSAVGSLGVADLRPADTSGIAYRLKQVGDRLVAAALLVLLAPLLLTVAVAIRVDSPGPILFRQTRVGRRGQEFTIAKFRTMAYEAPHPRDYSERNDCPGVLFKLVADPRVTRVGRYLRRVSLDELPQLWNVVRGEMSLVGPRPALPSEVARYDIDPRRRLSVLPGITGLWQVSGRSDLSWEQTVRLDLAYVDNWSPALDLAILGRTIGAVLGGRGAY